jgi:hypothetical protein
MSVEFVEYIGDYKPYWPNAYDYANEGDDHLRNIKKGLLGTFPEFDKAIDYSSTELNIMDQWLGGDEKKGLIWKQNSTTGERDKILKVKPNGTIISEDELPPVGTIVPTISFSGAEEDFESLYDEWFVKCDGTTTLTDEPINVITGQPVFVVPNLSDNRFVRMAPTEDKINEKLEASVDISSWVIDSGIIFSIPTQKALPNLNNNHNHDQIAYGSVHDTNSCKVNTFYESGGYNGTLADGFYPNASFPQWNLLASKDNGNIGTNVQQFAMTQAAAGAPGCYRNGNCQMGTLTGYPHNHVILAKDDVDPTKDKKFYATVSIGTGGGTVTKPKSYDVVYYMRYK